MFAHEESVEWVSCSTREDLENLKATLSMWKDLVHIHLHQHLHVDEGEYIGLVLSLNWMRKRALTMWYLYCT